MESLRSRCHVNQGNEKFVGIRADSDNAMAYFPMGYRLPLGEEDLREDIIRLIAVLSQFEKSADRTLTLLENEAVSNVNFPINAYMRIIRDFLERGSYYIEKNPVKRRGDRGHIDWSSSLKRNVAFYEEDGRPFFNDFTVKSAIRSENHLLTQIHKYCVYESFLAIDWLFTPDMPKNPHVEKNPVLFLDELRRKLAVTYNDRDKMLFQAMIAMLSRMDEKTEHKQSYFGTYRFEYIWEKLIDEVFGIKEKADYFPRTKWTLRYAEQKYNYVLKPDTIMVNNGMVYIIDAKYYRYGISGDVSHLPSSASISKQIIYGEYVDKLPWLKEKYGDDVCVYNAFLMPYNSDDNSFGIHGDLAYIGEAVSEWKDNGKAYERIQGILVDVRFLLQHYYGSHKGNIGELSQIIDDALKKQETEQKEFKMSQ